MSAGCAGGFLGPVHPFPFVMAVAMGVGVALGFSGVAFSIGSGQLRGPGPGLRVVSTSEDWSVVQPHSQPQPLALHQQYLFLISRTSWRWIPLGSALLPLPAPLGM